MPSHDSTTLHPRTRNLLGLTFGRLTPIAFAGYRVNTQGLRCAYWLCQCTCGTVKEIRAAALISETRSCGCWTIEKSTRHGYTKKGPRVPEYAVWASMIDRCENPNSPVYHNYGGRGITICSAWRNSFATFLADMGSRTGPEYSLERVNNELGYCPENCIWATITAQGRNTRSNVLLTWDGRTQCVASWAEELGIARNILYLRLRDGWSIDRAFTTPVRPKRPNGTGRTPTPPTAD